MSQEAKQAKVNISQQLNQMLELVNGPGYAAKRKLEELASNLGAAVPQEVSSTATAEPQIENVASQLDALSLELSTLVRRVEIAVAYIEARIGHPHDPISGNNGPA